MDILLTGRLSAVSHSFCDQLTPYGKVVASATDLQAAYLGNLHKMFAYSIGSDEYHRLFSIYSFDTVVFFLGIPETDNADFNILSDLKSVLADCAEHAVSQVILISSTYVYEGAFSALETKSPVFSFDTEWKILLKSCNQLCGYFRSHSKMNVTVLRTPIFYGIGENSSPIGKMVSTLVQKNCIYVPAAPGQTLELISLEDLGELVSRIILEPNPDIDVIDVAGASLLTAEQLESLFSLGSHISTVSYAEMPVPAGPPVASDTARREYDFVPVKKIEDDVQTLVENVWDAAGEQKVSWREKLHELLIGKRFILISAEIALGYILMEYLNRITSTSVQFRFVDFRLLFVILIASNHGLKSGLASAALACFSLMTAYVLGGTDLHQLLLNIDMWLPFACYILAGSVIGYLKDRHDKTEAGLTGERDAIRQRFVFQSELYENALYNKDQYRRQIMSYRNSFGRIFEVTRKLNAIMPDSVLKEAVLALEDVLDNHTISIYSISEDGDYARLSVCSQKVMGVAGRSIKLEDYRQIISHTQPGEVWANIAANVSLPDYAFPLFKEERLIALIFVGKVSFEQMSMYFQNLVKILCNLIKDSLVRALNYMDKFEDEMYLMNSAVLKKDAFQQILRIREEMEQDSLAQYALLKIEADDQTIVGIAERIEKYFRSSDVLGQGEDGNLYVLLSGADRDSVKIVMKRLENSGILIAAVE